MAITQQFKVYKKRWYMLSVVALLNFSNAMLWISYAPIANYTSEFYCKGECSAADWLSLIFLGMGVPFGLVAMWSMGRLGLRAGVLYGAWTDLIGAIIRVLSSAPFVPQSIRLPAAIVGQAVAATANPFSMFLPTKLAASWFADDQRALANTIGSMANPLGILCASLLSPLVVTSADDILLMNVLVLIPALVVAFMATFGVTHSEPSSPPISSAAAVNTPPFLTGLKMCVVNPSFVILAIAVGGGVGLFNAIVTLNEQFLCSNGYSNVFAGLTGAIMILSGFVGAVAAGLFVDRTKRFEETAKVFFCGAGLVGCGVTVTVGYPGTPVVIAICIGLFGLFGFALLPIGLELGVEVTYPVAEATSSGAIITMGQIEGILFILIMQAVTRPPTTEQLRIEVCTSGTNASVDVLDWAWSMVAWNVITVLLVIAGVLLFWPRYKRLEAEKQNKLTNA